MDDSDNLVDAINESSNDRPRPIDKDCSHSSSITTSPKDSSTVLKEQRSIKTERSILETIHVSNNVADSGKTSHVSSESDKTVTISNTRVPAPSVDHLYPRSFPSDIRIVQVGERSWMCDICKRAHFDNFVEACMHEMVCKSSPAEQVENFVTKVPSSSSVPMQLTHSGALPAIGPILPVSKDTKALPVKRNAVKKPLPLTMSTRPKPSKPKVTKNQISAGISLVPENRTVLSDYNYILTQNIEFFEVSASYTSNAFGMKMDDLPKSKVGLRCIHCSSSKRHVTAASFFPSSTGSISSGMGTIGSRHFIGGKCPSFPKEILQRLSVAKKISQQQTRSPGKLGLDAYCKQLAKTEHIFDHEVGGIFIVKKAQSTTEEDSSMDETELEILPSKPSADEMGDTNTSVDLISAIDTVKKPPAKQIILKDAITDRNDPFAFKEGSIEHFWECGHCSSLPFHWRASGSVVFSATAPTIDLVGKHLSICQGKKPLRIPRNATIKIRKSDPNNNTCSVVIKWSNDDGLRKSGRIKRQSTGPDASKKRRKVPAVASEEVKRGVEDTRLTVSDDKALTTDFAHYTVLQLKKCYLTKAGGSRGNCPIGYPGLACSYCAGSPNQRRFFYTSADHLRNSFSHIPSHLVMCSKCPADVKEKIEEYKAVRNKQKTQLKVGDHKIFIDRVWKRLHGAGGGVIDVPAEASNIVEDSCDDDRTDRTNESVMIDFLCNPSDDFLNESLDGNYLECKEIAMETSASEIISSSDKKLASNYVFYSLLQMGPKQYCIDTKNNISEVRHEDYIQDDKAKSTESAITVAIHPAKSKNDVCKIENSPRTSSNALNVECNADTGAKELCSDNPQTDVHNDNADTNQQSDENLERFETLVCKHCMYEGLQETAYFPRSAEELRTSFAEIPQHILSCSKCPQSVKSKLETLKAHRPIQEAMLKRGAQIKLTNSIWNKLTKYFDDIQDDIPTTESNPDIDSFTSDVLTTCLLGEKDRILVSEFTFYTMEQMEPCVLQNSGNGSRSMFAYGFPGLACKHCSGKPTGRKFFYRTSEILSGNYAHIPNHVLSCKHCPLEVKQTLAAKKRLHQAQKQNLRRGSQRIFFNLVWDRLHARTRKGK